MTKIISLGPTVLILLVDYTNYNLLYLSPISIFCCMNTSQFLIILLVSKILQNIDQWIKHFEVTKSIVFVSKICKLVIIYFKFDITNFDKTVNFYRPMQVKESYNSWLIGKYRNWYKYSRGWFTSLLKFFSIDGQLHLLPESQNLFCSKSSSTNSYCTVNHNK